MIIDGIAVREHPFPQKLKEWRFNPLPLHDGVRDMDTWIKRVVHFARANKTDGYTLEQIEGDAFEHLVQCIIERYGSDVAEVDSISVGAPHEGYPGLDLLGRTNAGKSHAHQCKFKSGAKNVKLGKDDIESLSKVELKTGSRKTLWTTGSGINSQLNKLLREHVQVLAIDWLRETLDGDDAFWSDVYAAKFEVEIKYRRGLIDEGNLNFTSPDRGYQLEALKTFKKEVANNPHELKGRYVYPTSAGKTLIEALILNHQLERLDGFGVHVIIAPRIALLTQLMREFRGFIGDKYGQIGFHSGDDKYEGRDYDYDKHLNLSVQRKTTKIEKVQSEVNRARRDNFPLVIFSTYHSLHKLVDACIPFETMIADESQYCISKKYFEGVQRISSKVKLYFTATERRAESGVRRNNNVAAFGEILGQEFIEVLVRRNILAEPRLLLVIGKSESESDYSYDRNIPGIDDEDEENAIAKYLIDLAGHIAEEQRNQVNDALPAKTLFACQSAKHVRVILGEKNLQNLMDRVNKIDPSRGHAIFTISSETGAKIDGKNVSRGEFLKRLGEHQGNALIFHHDILSEGIDIDGITGVAILRNMRYAKTLQTIGRCLRPYKEDSSLKPHAFVSVPIINGNVLESDLLENTVRQMLTSGLDMNYEDIDINFLDKDPPLRPPQPGGGNSGSGGIGPPGQQPGLDLRQELLTEVRHKMKILTERINEEWEEEQHAVMLSQEVTADFIADLLDGKYGSEQKPLKEDLATYRNRHHIIDRVWETGRIRDSKHLETKDGPKPMRPLTPMKIVKEHVDKIGDIDGKIALTYNVEYVPYLKEQGADVVLATKYFCEDTKTLAESQVIETEYMELETVMKRDMKFDIVVGNPPYQEKKEGYKKSQETWPFFVEGALNILKDEGTLALIHPPGWRNFGGGVLEDA